MSLLDPIADTTTPAQRVAARIKENIRIAATMLLQTYNVGYTDLWFSTSLDGQRNLVAVDPIEIAEALGTDGPQVLSLTAIIGQLFGAAALTPIPVGYSYTVVDGVLKLTYVDPDSSSSSSESSKSSESSESSESSSSSEESHPPINLGAT